MPIISKVGSRSVKVRVVYGTIYTLLIVGALTMIYPFMLMISGSMKSEADSVYITPLPKFWARCHSYSARCSESGSRVAASPPP